jgi:dienelactone hydrolase
MSELRAFDYSHEGAALRGQLALPAGAGPHPGVLVMHDARGLGEQVRERALRLAQAGYAALATDMYGGGVHFDDPAQAGPHYGALHNAPERLRGRVLTGFEALRAQPAVDAARIGAIGFCFGGLCALDLARSGAPVRAVVSFHGILKTALPARAGEVKAKLLVLTGARDPYAPPQDVAALEAEMAAAGADCHVTSYSEGWHAFTDPRAAAMSQVPGLRYDPLLDKLSWAQAMAFLDALVRPAG